MMTQLGLLLVIESCSCTVPINLRTPPRALTLTLPLTLLLRERFHVFPSLPNFLFLPNIGYAYIRSSGGFA